MSSLNIDSDLSGEEVRNLTMQWNYGTPVTSRRSKREQRKTLEEREPMRIPGVLNDAICVMFKIAGAATTITAICLIKGWIQIEGLSNLISFLS